MGSRHQSSIRISIVAEGIPCDRRIIVAVRSDSRAILKKFPDLMLGLCGSWPPVFRLSFRPLLSYERTCGIGNENACVELTEMTE